MPRPPVFTEVMDVIQRRIAAGEYMLKDLPGERTIAEEVGVSYMTARKAVSRLIEHEVLTRRPNGSLTLHPRVEQRIASCRVALLIPAYPSTHLMRCRLDLTRAMDRRGFQHRTVEYLHWDDSVVSQALDGADGVLVIPMTEPMPARILRQFQSAEARVAAFDGDFTRFGLPSVRLFAREHIELVLEHLLRLGHRRIDCLNTQGHNGEIDVRIEIWRSWLGSRGCRGELWDDPAAAHTDAIERAHGAMARVLRGHRDELDSVICTTQPAAIGAMRACRDVGVEVGRDISVCTMNNEPTGRFLCPSLTGLEMPDIAPLLEGCFDWFAGERDGFGSEVEIFPSHPVLFEGESTGPTPVR